MQLGPGSVDAFVDYVAHSLSHFLLLDAQIFYTGCHKRDSGGLSGLGGVLVTGFVVGLRRAHYLPLCHCPIPAWLSGLRLTVYKQLAKNSRCHLS